MRLARADGIFSIFPAVSRHFFIVCFSMEFDKGEFYVYACIKMTKAKRMLKGTKRDRRQGEEEHGCN